MFTIPPLYEKNKARKCYHVWGKNVGNFYVNIF